MEQSYIHGIEFRPGELHFILCGELGLYSAVICAFDVIEHIEDDNAVLKGIFKALKPNGQLILTVPQYQFMWSSIDDYVHHKRRYEKKDLVAKFEAAGFQVSYVTSFVFMLFPLMLLSRLLNKSNESAPSTSEFSKQVRFNPIINYIFDKIMRLDEALIARRWRLPWGGTLFIIGRRKDN